MFGTYRTILAMMVAVQHIGGVERIGSYAVFGFYILSGYLMTLILQSTYGYSLAGIARYAANRFLRIYPIYWISIALSVGLVYWVGSDYARAYHEDLFMPATGKDWLRNVLLIFPHMEAPRLTPPAWALTVELVFYALIGFGLSRSKRLTTGWLVASVLYHLMAQVWGWNIYFPIAAASLPFATGAMVFHLRQNSRARATALPTGDIWWPTALVLCAIFGNWGLSGIIPGAIRLHFYLNYVLCAVAVYLLAGHKDLPLISLGLDKRIGDLSYPIYLFHYQVALLVLLGAGSIGIELHRPDFSLFLVSVPPLLATAWIIAVVLERPIDLLRSRLRGLHRLDGMRERAT